MLKAETDVKKFAGDYLSFFITGVRTDGKSEYLYLRPEAPTELRNLVRKAHGRFLPDDWRYDFIYDALCLISNAEEGHSVEELRDEIEPDVYTIHLLRWFSSNLQRPYYVDEAVEEFGHGKSIIDDLMQGQVQEKQEVFDLVLSALLDIAQRLEKGGKESWLKNEME